MSVLGRRKPAQWEEDIHFIYSDLPKDVPSKQAKKAYVEEASRWPAYGCAFFDAKQYHFKKYPTEVLLGISLKGILVLRQENKEVLAEFRLGDIYRWGFKPGTNFYFEIKSAEPGSGPVYDFDTEVGNRISDLLTAYAMALLREMGIRSKQEEARVLGQSATLVQAQWRRVQALKQVEKRREGPRMEAAAAHTMQRLFRGFAVRNSMSKQVAAILVQSVWRGYKERCQFDEMITQMERELEEAGMGEEEAHEEAEKFRLEASAMMMQRHFRGYQVRRDLIHMEEELAASRIQVS